MTPTQYHACVKAALAEKDNVQHTKSFTADVGPYVVAIIAAYEAAAEPALPPLVAFDPGPLRICPGERL